MRNIIEALQFCRSQLPLSEAEFIVSCAVERVKNVSLGRIDLYSSLNLEIDEKIEGLIKKWSQARVSGETLQYLTGKQKFLDHEYWVGSGVLVPRPETEILVQTAIHYFEGRSILPTYGFEVGVGSGVISIELLKHFKNLKIVASEVSLNAIKYAEKNKDTILNDPHRLSIVHVSDPTDVLSSFSGIADFLISNPPYLSHDDEIAQDVMRNEPHEALFPKNLDPLYFYKEISTKAHILLKTQGVVFLELSECRSQVVAELFKKNGWVVILRKDLSGRDRILIAQKEDI